MHPVGKPGNAGGRAFTDNTAVSVIARPGNPLIENDDPFYSPNLTRTAEDYSYRKKMTLERPA